MSQSRLWKIGVAATFKLFISVYLQSIVIASAIFDFNATTTVFKKLKHFLMSLQLQLVCGPSDHSSKIVVRNCNIKDVVGTKIDFE
jgi:hypothetical protein